MKKWWVFWCATNRNCRQRLCIVSLAQGSRHWFIWLWGFTSGWLVSRMWGTGVEGLLVRACVTSRVYSQRLCIALWAQGSSCWFIWLLGSTLVRRRSGERVGGGGWGWGLRAMHCFTGTREQTLVYLAMGFFIGVTGERLSRGVKERKGLVYSCSTSHVCRKRLCIASRT